MLLSYPYRPRRVPVFANQSDRPTIQPAHWYSGGHLDSTYYGCKDRAGNGASRAVGSVVNLAVTGAKTNLTRTGTRWGTGITFSGATTYYEAVIDQSGGNAKRSVYPISFGAVFTVNDLGGDQSVLGEADRVDAALTAYCSLMTSSGTPNTLRVAIRPETGIGEQSVTSSITPVVGRTYSAAYVSYSATNHNLYAYELETGVYAANSIANSMGASGALDLTHFQVGALVRFSTPGVLNVGKHTLLNWWFDAIFPSGSTGWDSQIKNWVTNPFSLYRGYSGLLQG